MTCTRCGGELRVLDSRDAPENSVRRRRGCERCNTRFTTYEQIRPEALSVDVVKVLAACKLDAEEAARTANTLRETLEQALRVSTGGIPTPTINEEEPT